MSEFCWVDDFFLISSEFFKCRPHLNTENNRKILEEGFLLGWQARDAKNNEKEIIEE